MRARLVLILAGLSVMWGLLVARAAYLQLLPNTRLKALEHKQFETVVTLNPRRGDVVDRAGNELAVSMTTYSLFADPKILEGSRRALAKFLGEALGRNPKEIEGKLRGKKRFVWIERQIGKTAHDAILARKIRGLGFIEESQRIYPNERLLAHVLGFVGGDGQGLEGLELRMNEQLQATSLKVSMRRDARGRPLVVNGQIFNQVPDGSDVQLTIDRELQFIAEQELAEAVRKHEADSAVAVVLDAQTSEVLAMASSPSFDPNRAGDFPIGLKRNRTVTDSFEPGSTMKTFIVAGALARGLVEPNTKFDCEGGALRIGKRVVREADTHHKFGVLTVSEILALSSNVGVTKIGFQLGDEKVLETLKLFGFGEKTGIDLPGEVRGILQPLPWHPHLLSNISFGHGLNATPLQIANAYAAIANGGWLKQPYIVKSVHDHEGDEVFEGKPRVLRRVLTDEQVAKMKIMLAGVTSDIGTGQNARVPGFPVAGKTGTAQKINANGRGYLKGGYVSSFAGFLPANDPRFVIYVAVDRPRKEYYGGYVAAPVFSRIAQFAVRRAGLAPVMLKSENLVPQARRVHRTTSPQPATRDLAVDASLSQAGAVVPDLTGLTLREVLARVTGSGLKVHVRGEGFVSATSPSAGAKLAENQDLVVTLSR